MIRTRQRFPIKYTKVNRAFRKTVQTKQAGHYGLPVQIKYYGFC